MRAVPQVWARKLRAALHHSRRAAAVVAWDQRRPGPGGTHGGSDGEGGGGAAGSRQRLAPRVAKAAAGGAEAAAADSPGDGGADRMRSARLHRVDGGVLRDADRVPETRRALGRRHGRGVHAARLLRDQGSQPRPHVRRKGLPRKRAACPRSAARACQRLARPSTGRLREPDGLLQPERSRSCLGQDPRHEEREAGAARSVVHHVRFGDGVCESGVFPVASASPAAHAPSSSARMHPPGPLH